MENIVLFIVGAVAVFAIGYYVNKSRDKNTSEPMGGLPEPRERPGKGSNK